MSKQFIITPLSTLTVVAGLAMASPAQAQLGGLSGSVNGTLDSSVRQSTNITARSHTRAKLRVPSPRTNVKVRARSPATISYGATRSGGYHAHGDYHYHTHTHGHDHFYDNHAHAQAHGYYQRGNVSIHGDVKAGGKAKTQRYSKADLLTFGTLVRSENGVSLGAITSLQRTRDGEIIGVTIGDATQLISVDQLKVEGNVLVHHAP